MNSLKELTALSGHDERVWHVCWDEHGKELATCGSDKTIRIWGKQNDDWMCKAQLEEGHQRTIRKIAWAPCGKRLASASFDSTVCIWENEGGEFDCSATLEGHENEVKGVDWSVSGSYLATSSRDKSVWVWDAYEDDFECAGVLTSHKQDVKDVKWSPTEDVLASCSYDNTINIYEEDDGEWVTADTLTGHESTVWCISWHKSGDMLASASDDKTVKIWKRYKPDNNLGISMGGRKVVWKCICTLSGYHDRTIYSIDWSHVNDMIATAGGDDCIRIFKEDRDSGGDSDSPNFTQISSFPNAHSQDINAIAWNPVQSDILASASDDGLIKIWKAEPISIMITPSFSVSQDDEFLTIIIQAPYCNISLADIFIEDNLFKFYAKPYFLRLHLSGNIVEDDRSDCSYDCDAGEFTVKVSKSLKGEHFKDLELLTKLLTPATKTTNKTSLIEVISETNNSENLPEENEIDYDELYFKQTLPVEDIDNECKTDASHGYGFANKKHNVFTKLQGDPYEVLCIQNPDKKSIKERKEERICSENDKFDSDHYLADLYDNNHIPVLISMKLPLKVDTFTNEEKMVLKDLPKTSYLLEQSEVKILCFSLVDLLFAFAYNYRVTEGENNVESAWNIRTVSATLSCCDSYLSLQEALITCYRRSLSYPLYRNYELAKTCQTDVEKILKHGKISVLKCLLEMHEMFSKAEQFYLLNNLYITDYCVWIQSLQDSAFGALSKAVKSVKITKKDLEFELEILEHAAELVMNECDSSEDESGSCYSSSEYEESSEDDLDEIDVKLKHLELMHTKNNT